MKYYQTSKFPKFVGSAGFYVILACCLLAIGAASWFAVSRYNSATEKPESSSGSSNSSAQSRVYSDQQSAYNSSSAPTTPSAGAANPVSDVPYDSEETKPEPAQSFTSPIDGTVTKGYSDSALQYSATYGDMRLHTGTDIACEKGSDVRAAGNGTVTAVDESASLGKVVTIDHGDGIVIKYCGFDSVATAVGKKVATGDVIGTSGTVPCECSDQSHMHLEATKDGNPVSVLAALGLE